MRKLLALCVCLISFSAAQADEPRTLVMTGTGSVSVVPDMATIVLGVQTIAPSAEEAMIANNAPTGRIIELFKKAGVKAEDISTHSLAVYPRFTHNRNDDTPPEITGYQVSNTISVNVHKISELGALLDQAIKAGANNVQQISFDTSDPSAALSEARKAAVGDARMKAEEVAEAAGIALGPILSIAEAGSRAPQPLYRAQAELARSSVPVEAGSQEISASVTIVWEIAE